MQQHWSRRGFLGMVGAAGLSVVAGCSSHKPAPGTPNGGAVTIRHLFGETTIPAPPARVVCAGYTGQDDLLAVGVVPIAVTNWFGDQPFAVWPWAQPKLGSAHPVVLDLNNGIAVDQIAALKPDLIVATNAGVDEDTYQKLSAISPTVPQSDGDAFFEPWKDQASAIGQAVFHAGEMNSLVDAVDKKFATVAQDNPHFNGKKVLLLQGKFDESAAIATMPGWRTEFLTQMGLIVADSIDSFAVDNHAVIPPDHIKSILDAADVLIWTTDSQDDQQALLANPDVADLQARSIFTTKDQAGAIAFASPLSYPLVADQLPPLIDKVVG